MISGTLKVMVSTMSMSPSSEVARISRVCNPGPKSSRLMVNAPLISTGNGNKSFKVQAILNMLKHTAVLRS